MRTITKEIHLYNYDELTPEAKENALIEFIEAEIELMNEDSPFYPAVLKAEKLQTPWFTGSIINEMYHDTIIEHLRTPEAEYTQDGKFYGYNYEVK